MSSGIPQSSAVQADPSERGMSSEQSALLSRLRVAGGEQRGVCLCAGVATKAQGFARFFLGEKSKVGFVRVWAMCCWVLQPITKEVTTPSVELAQPKHAEMPQPDTAGLICRFLSLKWSQSSQFQRAAVQAIEWEFSALHLIREHITCTQNGGNSLDMWWSSVTVINNSSF